VVKTYESGNLVIPTSITPIKGEPDCLLLTVGVAAFHVRVNARSMNARPSYARIVGRRATRSSPIHKRVRHAAPRRRADGPSGSDHINRATGATLFRTFALVLIVSAKHLLERAIPHLGEKYLKSGVEDNERPDAAIDRSFENLN
jgi:hypothetical protein